MSGQRNLQPCGTPAAYRRHWLRGEPACQPCLDANAAYARGDWEPDTIIDEIAVERAARGEDVPLTRLERIEAARLIIAAGGTPYEISKRLRTSGARALQLYERITGCPYRYEVKHATRASVAATDWSAA